ncbi:MAG: SH3 domain-containing protein [Bacteroidia bacterium]|nr:SH3 domain-containing protein [Bacteroidia bacterium]
MKSLLLLVPVLFIVGCTHPVVQPDIQKGIDSIASKWVPDIREAIADVTIGKNNEGLFVLTGETSLPGLKDDVTAYLENMKVKYTDNFNLLPDSSINDKPWGLVSISVANVKALPSYSSELVSQAIMGTPVKIFKKKGGWLLVQTPDFYVGWVNDSGLQEVNNEEIEAWKNSKRLRSL